MANNFIYFNEFKGALNMAHVLRFEVVNAGTQGIFVGALMTDGYRVKVKSVSSEEEGQVYICTLAKHLGGGADREISLKAAFK